MRDSISWYRVGIGLLCLYILEKVEIWLGVTDAWHLTPSQTTEYRATQLVENMKFKLSHAMTRLNSHGAAVSSILLQFFSSRQIGVTHVTWWLAWHSKEVFGPQVQRLIPSQGAFQRSSSRLNHNVKVILGLVWVTIQSISRCWDWKKQQMNTDHDSSWSHVRYH